MMVAIAVVGIEFGLIAALAIGIGPEPRARVWLVSTFVVTGLQLPVFLLIKIGSLYIKKSHILDVVTYRGPLRYKGQVIRKDDS